MTHQATPADRGEVPVRVTCIAADEPSATVLAHLVAAVLPGAAIGTIDPTSVRNVPDADCALLGGLSNKEAALSTLRGLRARGFKAPTICITEDGADCDDESRARLGISHTVEASMVPARLPQAIREATQLDARALSSSGVARALKALRQTQRLLAAGDIAMKMQHSLNNPLAALLAEAQLLELEELTPDHRKAVERIIELSRRLIDVTRTLEGIGSR